MRARDRFVLSRNPQARRSASRNRAKESALGEADSSVSFNGAELTAELSMNVTFEGIAHR